MADENTRTALQNAITEANTVMNGTSPSESDVNNAISKLQKAESDVTASMQAKQQADAAKQAQEEAQQKADQEAQQKSQDESNNSDNNNGGDNSTSTDGTPATTEVCSVLLFLMGGNFLMWRLAHFPFSRNNAVFSDRPMRKSPPHGIVTAP